MKNFYRILVVCRHADNKEDKADDSSVATEGQSTINDSTAPVDEELPVKSYASSSNTATESAVAGKRTCVIIMAALRSRCGHYIFIMWFLLSSSSSSFSSPNLSGRRLDVYHTSTHGVALV